MSKSLKTEWWARVPAILTYSFLERSRRFIAILDYKSQRAALLAIGRSCSKGKTGSRRRKSNNQLILTISVLIPMRKYFKRPSRKTSMTERYVADVEESKKCE